MSTMPGAADPRAGIDPFLLSILRCPDCLAPGLRISDPRSKTELVCSRCRRRHAVVEPGIPSLWASELKSAGLARHEDHWDALSEDAYESVCRDNALALAAVDRIAMAHCRGATLEIGCGRGRFLRQLAHGDRVANAVGLDVSAGMLRFGWRDGLRLLVHAPAERLPFADRAFDAVVSMFSSLKYVDRSKGYAEIARVLRPGGALVFDLLNYWTALIDAAWGKGIARGRWPRGLCQDYLLAHNMRSARREVLMMEQAGLRLVEMKSVRYLPFLRSRLKSLGYWNGYLGSAIGYDTIFVVRKS